MRAKEEAMLKTGLAALAVAAIATTALMAPANAQDRRYRDYYGDNYRYGNTYDSGSRQYTAGERRGQRDPSQLDGRRTGQPRTCGFDFFQYDNRGVPSGPYCN